MVKNIIITGATGFIGSAVLTELLKQGARVTVLLRPHSNYSRLKNIFGFESIIFSDILDKNTIDLLCSRKPEIFIHCAWQGVSGQDRNEEFQITSNLPFVLDTVKLASVTGCKQWIGLGSQAEYGNHNTRLDEDAPTRPTTLYGAAKLAAGIAALALCEARGMAGVWLRVFSTYGPGDSPHWFLPYVTQEFLAKRAPQLTKCEQFWDYLHVYDAARALFAVADGETAGIFNLGSGLALPLKNYIEEIRSELNSLILPDYGVLPYRSDQVMHLEADVRKLYKKTGWSPRIGVKEGIKNMIAFDIKEFDKSVGK